MARLSTWFFRVAKAAKNSARLFCSNPLVKFLTVQDEGVLPVGTGHPGFRRRCELAEKKAGEEKEGDCRRRSPRALAVRLGRVRWHVEPGEGIV